MVRFATCEVDTTDTLLCIHVYPILVRKMVSKTEKLRLLRQIKELKEKEGLSFREISKRMGKKEAWAGVFWRRNKILHPLLDTKVDTKPSKVDTKPKRAMPLEPIPAPAPKLEPSKPPPKKRASKPPSSYEMVMKRMEQLEGRMAGFLLTPEQRRWLDVRDRLDPLTWERFLALTELEAALKRNVEAGTTRFKPRDLKDTQEILGKEAFTWAWKRFLKLGIIVHDKTSTAGRYYYNPLE